MMKDKKKNFQYLGEYEWNMKDLLKILKTKNKVKFIDLIDENDIIKVNKVEAFNVIEEGYQKDMTIKDLAIIVEKGFNQVNNRLDKVEHRLDKVEHRLDKVEQRLDNLEKDVSILKQDVEILKKDVSLIKKCPTIQKELKTIKS